MKARIRIARAMFLVSIIGISIVAMRSCWHSMYTINAVTITHDSNLSSTTHQTIDQYIRKQHSTRTTPHTVTAILKQQFPCIDDMVAHVYAPGSVHYMLRALLPRIKVNNTHVLLPNGFLVPQTWFCKDLLNSLPAMTTAQSLEDSGLAPNSLLTLALHVPKSVLDEYHLQWINDTQAYLHHTHMPLRIICNATHMPDAHLLAHCQRMYTELNTGSLQTKTPLWCADIRFNNQIVFHAEQKGTAHGT